MADRSTDRLFERIDAVTAHLADITPHEAVEQLRPEVRRLLISFRDDGSWPETELLAEAIRALLDSVDVALAEHDMTERELPADDQRWLDACRRCTESPELLDDMLADLRPEIGRAGYSAIGRDDGS